MKEAKYLEQRSEWRLADWNGKNTAPLLAIFDSHKTAPDFVAALLESVQVTSEQDGATWLLKHGVEHGLALNRDETDRFVDSFSKLDAWPAQLHALQILPFLTLSAKHETLIDTFLSKCRDNQNKFVRAWCFNGYMILANRFPAQTEHAREILEKALCEEEAASVKARLRKILAASP